MKKDSFLPPRVLNFFKEYLELDTSLSSGENYHQAISLLDDLLKGLDFENEVVVIPESIAGGKNRVNLIARKYISKDLPTLLIYNHIDVVPATHKDAFKFQIIDNKIYGRGAADQKGGTVGILSALESLQDKKLRFNLIFIATTDEETEQLEQLRYITPKLNLPKQTIVFDADTFTSGVTIATLGMLDLEILIKGKSAHSAMSNLGKNAIEDAGKLIAYFAKVKEKFEKVESKHKPFKTLSVNKATSRCNVTMISGGMASNVVPDSCKITVNFRFIPELNVAKETEKILKDLDAFCKKEKIDYEIIKKHGLDGHVGMHPLAEELNKFYEEVSGEEGGLYCALGSTPVSGWTNELNLPRFSLGAIREENNVHGTDEFVYIKDIVNLSKTLEKFLTQVAK